MQKVLIYIENGPIFHAKTNTKNDFITYGELVFTTSMTGYQETITDPSFASQIIVMSSPLIGNYGTNIDWNECDKIHAKGMIVHNYSGMDSENSFQSMLDGQNITLIHSIDTRNLIQFTRHMFYPKCVISTKELNENEINKHLQMINPNVVHQISTKKCMHIKGSKDNNKKIGIIDFGCKKSIAKELERYFSEIVIMPYDSNIDDIKNLELHCVLLSNGPGNPDILYDVIENIKNMLGKVDVFGICLGHQLLGLALNCQTAIMKFGHRGVNHPVMNMQNEKVIITSQNHGYEILENSLSDDIRVTHRNLHDNTIEGIESMKHRAKSVQFHPEASPGPRDANVIFDEWFGG